MDDKEFCTLVIFVVFFLFMFVLYVMMQKRIKRKEAEFPLYLFRRLTAPSANPAAYNVGATQPPPWQPSMQGGTPQANWHAPQPLGFIVQPGQATNVKPFDADPPTYEEATSMAPPAPTNISTISTTVTQAPAPPYATLPYPTGPGVNGSGPASAPSAPSCDVHITLPERTPSHPS